MGMGEEVYILALGSNEGSRLFNLLHAIECLRVRGVEVAGCSRVYLTEPVGLPQGWFLNCAVVCAADLEPSSMLGLCKDIERLLGRREEIRWGPRVVDLDVVLWSGGSYVSRELVIPHPRWCKRLFVVKPLMDLGVEEMEGVSLGRLEDELAGQKVIPLEAASFWLRHHLEAN